MNDTSWRLGCLVLWHTAARLADVATQRHWWSLWYLPAAATRRRGHEAASGRWDVDERSCHERRPAGTVADRSMLSAQQLSRRRATSPWLSCASEPSSVTSSGHVWSRKLWRRQANERKLAGWLLTRRRWLERSETDRGRGCPEQTVNIQHNMYNVIIGYAGNGNTFAFLYAESLTGSTARFFL